MKRWHWVVVSFAVAIELLQAYDAILNLLH